LPGWQKVFHERHGEDLVFLSVALDAQGDARLLPYAAKDRHYFVTLMDGEKSVGGLYGFKAIPNGLLIDERGILRHKVFSAFDIGRPETRVLLGEWLSSSAPLSRPRFQGED
jgi:hypothetical protein